VGAVASDGSHLVRLAYDLPGKGCERRGKAAAGVCRSVPEWSPDGKRIAFQCQVQPSASNPGYSRICVMDANGSNVRQLPQTPATGLSDGAPAWSPDGKEIAFDRGVGDQHAVFLMNTNGSDAREVTPWSLAGGQPDWSPDGKRLVFYSNYQGPPSKSANLYLISPDGTGLVQLTHAVGGKVQYLSASFSPDGKWIAFARTPGTGTAGNDVYVMRADGTAVTDVTHSASWDSGVDWGPKP
jgi:TolB protein